MFWKTKNPSLESAMFFWSILQQVIQSSRYIIAWPFIKGIVSCTTITREKQRFTKNFLLTLKKKKINRGSER